MRIYFRRFICGVVVVLMIFSAVMANGGDLVLPAAVSAVELSDEDAELELIVELKSGGVLELCAVPSARMNEGVAMQSVAMAQTQAEARVASVTETQVEGRLTHIMNALVLKGGYSDIEKIKALPEVKAVYISETVEIVKPLVSVEAEAQGALDVACAEQNALLGDKAVRSQYDGDGMVIGFVDSELWYDHLVFDTAPTDAALSVSDIEAYLAAESLAAESLAGGAAALKASDVYKSAKVPFAFDYADKDADPKTENTANYHGTHVVGIAAADGDGITGVASNAQVAFAKVSPDGASTSNTKLMAYALDDLVKLGVDVINMSMGVPAGFSNGQGLFDAVYERIESAGIPIILSAGNDGRYGDAFDTGAPLADAPDYGLLGSPATVEYSVAVAAVGLDTQSPNEYSFTLADGTTVGYYDSSWRYTEERFADVLDKAAVEYVDCGLGTDEGYTGITSLEGKVALITRGGASFDNSVGTAQSKGALAVIIINTEDAYGNVYAGGCTIPCAVVTNTCGAVLKAAQTKTLTAKKEPYKICGFSSRGATPDLRLKPEASAMGKWVFSAYYGGDYAFNAGTSMAAPQYAGACASVLDYINKGVNSAMSKSAKRTLAAQLLCSTAQVWAEDGEIGGLPASPRAQGAGVINIENAVTTPAVVMNTYNSKTKIELGEISGTEVEFEFKVKNISDASVTYNVSADVITDGASAQAQGDGKTVNVVDGVQELSGAEVTFDCGETVTVPAGGEKTVTARLVLDSEELAALSEVFTNGFFTEGYIYLSNDTDPELSIPFMGFCGDWSAVPVFGGEEYGLETLLACSNGSYIKRLNVIDNTGYYSPLTGALGVAFQNARHVQQMNVLVYDAEENEVYRRQYTYLRRSMDASKYALAGAFDGMLNEEALPDGNYTVRIDAAADCSDGLDNPQTMMFDIVLDSTMPELYDAVVRTQSVDQTSGRWLWVKAATDAEPVTPFYGVIDSEGEIIQPQYLTESGYRLFNVTGYSLPACKIYIEDAAGNAVAYDITAHDGYSVVFDGKVFKGTSLWDAYIVKDIILNRYDVEPDSTGYTKKLFVWDSNMMPLARPFTVQ
ncbi:MAG: S8 family serine peptidase [Clostridia bacterium]|nr:S8 family serine peptidase [Clostridia bacterium]